MHILWFYNAIHEYTPLRFLGFSVKFQRDHLLPLLLDSPHTPYWVESLLFQQEQEAGRVVNYGFCFRVSRANHSSMNPTMGSVSESRGLTIPLCNPTMRSVSIKSSCNPSVTTSLCFVRSSCSQAFVADSCKKGFNIDILWKSVAEISSAKWSPVFFPLLDTWEEYSPFSLASD